MNNKGILLINLGSPKSTSVKDVKEYLKEFLMDERVIDYNWFLRSLLVKGIILNTRPKKSAEAYKSIWTEEGSPLLVNTYKIKNKLQNIVDIPVEVGMRYAEPSIETGIAKLVEKGVDKIVVFPLYPQYAMSTTESVIVKTDEVIKNKFPSVQVKYVDPFYNNDLYIDCIVETIKEKYNTDFDGLLFSYHGIPERHIFKTDPTNTCNLNNCCDRSSNPSHQFCYKHQCFETTNKVIEKLNLSRDKTIVSFQSRLGKDKWIEPYTDATLKSIPSKGIKKIAILCPAFVSDCLETLEEIAIEGKEIFMDNGGEKYEYIPCLNDNDSWIKVIKILCEEKVNQFYLIN